MSEGNVSILVVFNATWSKNKKKEIVRFFEKKIDFEIRLQKKVNQQTWRH
jgi:hypothetical protein